MAETNTSKAIREQLKERILIIDGSMGVMIQELRLKESQFRGTRFRNHEKNLKGNNDILTLTCPSAIKEIHRGYLEAGADIIETNTFNANRLSQREYGTEAFVGELNERGARLAREEADRMTAQTPGKPRYVAGSMGPTGCTASMSADMEHPEARSVSYAELRDAFTEQAAGLLRGGVDLLLIETIFDTLNAKAAAEGARRAMKETGREVPIMLSMTVSDASGRILSGQTPEAFLTTMLDTEPLAMGFNCSTGPASLTAALRDFAEKSPVPVIFYPNAGLPDELGRYALTPELFAQEMGEAMKAGLVNIAGGCCGTGPEHIRALSEAAQGCAPRRTEAKETEGWLAGLDTFGDQNGFINVGERCNVAGSRKFLKLIGEKNYDEAVGIARKQVEDGAMVLDINMDDGMLDTREEMTTFLRRLGNDPETARIPWMIDTSDFGVAEAALENVQGRAIVNSISLKHGEEEFLRQARTIRAHGAAVVVMAFDEEGQATTFERKTAICERAYRLLTEKAGFAPRDIIFDANILTIATGMAEHDRYALDFIRAVAWVKENLPGAKTSGGVSNLSFAFRGNNYIRQAMHAVFLYHAIKAGLSMAIIDPGSKVRYADLDGELLEALEDAILCRRADATERLAEQAAKYSGVKIADVEQRQSEASQSADERLERALQKGDDSTLENDLEESLREHGSAVKVIEGPLMNGMEQVGKQFETGKMFLPQVVKAARTMHKAVEYLRPRMEGESQKGGKKGVFVTATVKGDVHDIGKNIVDVVLRCNNFEVVDLGVQVEAPTIVKAAKEHHADFIGLSGLITPSLNEMARVAQELEEAGITAPLFIGGAATSALHTAVKIAPLYSGVVARMGDAAQNPVAASRLLSNPEGEGRRIREEQAQLRAGLERKEQGAATMKRPDTDWDKEPIDAPTFTGMRTLEEIGVAEARKLINMTYLYNCWKVSGKEEAMSELKKDAEAMLDELEKRGATLRAGIGLYEAWSEEGKIVVKKPDGEKVSVETPRQRPGTGREECLSLSDFVAPEGYGDHAGVFAVTIGQAIRDYIAEAKASGDDYRHLLAQSVADRLVEAASELTHYRVRIREWGYAAGEAEDTEAMKRGKYRGIRPAVGYPSLPDQMQMHQLAKLVDLEALGMKVTENGALWPASSVAGFYLASPRSKYFTV